MPTPKKAAKKSAKKAAKKAAGHHNDKHHDAKDLRRAYEHMGRVAVLRQTSKSSATDEVAELINLAQATIGDGHTQDAANLLRASEHFSFAILADEVPGAGRISAELKGAITEHFDELIRRAEEHWEEEQEHTNIVTGIFLSCRNSAKKAFKARCYHRALEFARAAEALAHVKQYGSPKLEEGPTNFQLSTT